MRKILQFILKVLAKRVIRRYRPVVIGITGSVGKTTAKEAVYSVISRKFWTWKNSENFNNEWGVPMAVLMIRPGKFSSFLYKVESMLTALWLAFGYPKKRYPEVLVLELAADRPGDMEYLTDIVNPKIGVVTAVGELPVHVEFYASPRDVATEKSKLIESLPADGLAILNFDDRTVLDMKEKSKAPVITFGLAKAGSPAGEASVRASGISYFIDDQKQTIGGLSFKINNGNSFIPVRINNLVGPHQLYGILAGFAVGLHFGMNLIEISDALENIHLPTGRMTILHGVKNTTIINDCYNASPLSMKAALETLKSFAEARKETDGKIGRKIAVLGDMKELGKYSIQAHQAIGNIAGETADILITVGFAAKFIADSAANQIPSENIMSFDSSDEAKIKIQEILKEGDVILVKGSRSMQMERIVEEVSAK